jgi:hypothetical protein
MITVLRIRVVYAGFQILLFPSRNRNPDPRVKKIPDLDPHKRIEVFLAQKIVSQLSEK